MSPPPVRTLVVGAGLMGRWHAFEAVRAGGRLVGVVDPESHRARRLADRHGGRETRTFTSLREALGEVEADAVHVCSPGGTHVELVERALEAGANVLVEKPVAPTPEATASLVDRARDAGRILCPVFQFLFQRGVRQFLTAGRPVGTVRHVDFTALSAGAVGGDPGAVAREILPHPLSLLGRMVGEGLDGLSWRAVEPVPGEVRILAYDGGITASILISMSGRPTRNYMRVSGDRGTARFNLYHGYSVVSPAGRPSRVRKASAPFLLAGSELLAAGWNLFLRAVRLQPAYPGLRELVEAFQGAVVGDGCAPISPDELLRVARIRRRIDDSLAQADSA